jgi:WG containing repeat
VIPPKYDWVGNFTGGFASVVIIGKDGAEKEGVIDKSGREVVPPTSKYLCIGLFSALFNDGLAVVSTQDGFGYIDITGNEVIAPKFKSVHNFSEGLAEVTSGDKWGFIDTRGEFVISPKYDGCIPNLASKSLFDDNTCAYHESRLGFSNGIALVFLNGKAGLIDKKGDELLPCAYECIGPFINGFAWVIKDRLMGAIDARARLVVPIKYDAIPSFGFDLVYFNDGIAPAGLHGKYGFIDTSGNEVIPFIYEEFNGDFSSGTIAAMQNGKWGYINKSGKVIIPPNYEKAEPFSEALAAVSLHGKWGFIDTAGKFVIQPHYNSRPSEFRGGLAWITKETAGEMNPANHYLIDKAGREYREK